MLDDYRDIQDVAYSLLSNSINNNKISHAYLINANNYDKCYDFVKSFVKCIICDNHYTNCSECGNCNKCIRIDNNSYSEFKIIEPINGVIKKEQLLELQEDFSSSSIEGKYRVYVIKDCEKMNKHASNCLLKFLEEPVDNIIAILVTNNFSNVISTIVSRCQLINLVNINMINYDTTLENINALLKDVDVLNGIENIDKYQCMLDDVLSFLWYVEENGVDTLIYMKNLWYNKFKEREDFVFAMSLIEYFYYDVLKNKINKNDYFFSDKIDLIISVSRLNSIESITKKLEIINYANEMARSNLNLNLLIDDVVIRLGECNE